MKKLLLVALLLPALAHADTIRTSDGISCSFDADDNPYELSVYGESGSDDQSNYGVNYDNYGRDSDDKKVGIKLEYKFGGPERLECGKLYNLELRTKEARVKQLEEQVKALESVNNANW